MRLDKQTLYNLTKLRRISAQVRWFRDQLGVDVPFDRDGPIMTDAALEKLLEKRLGILPSYSGQERPKPTLRLIRQGNNP